MTTHHSTDPFEPADPYKPTTTAAPGEIRYDLFVIAWLDVNCPIRSTIQTADRSRSQAYAQIWATYGDYGY